MGSKYTTTAISGFNASPPSDDGSVAASNQLQWSKHLDKIGTPLKNLAESINTKLVTFTDFGSRSVSVSDSTVATDHMKTVEIASTATTGVTISLGDAATMAAGYIVTVKNLSAHSQVIGRVTSGDNINGAAQNVAIPPKGHYTFKVAATASNGYYTLDSAIHGHGSDIASAAAINLDTATGDLVDITGTTTITAVTLSDGRMCVARFTGALTLTHSANLVLPGAANIVTVAGDFAVFTGYASSVVRVSNYVRGSGAPGGNAVMGTATSATSTSVPFTGIPAWARKVTLSYMNMSSTSSSIPMVQLGDSGGIESSGYLGCCALVGDAGQALTRSTAGILLAGNWTSSLTMHGSVVLTLLDASTNTWIATVTGGMSDADQTTHGGASKALSGTLTQLLLTTVNGSDTFDNGLVNIQYE